MIRVEYAVEGVNSVYIVNGALQQVWYESNGQWIDLSSEYASQYNSWNNQFTDYRNTLGDWSGTGDKTYTDGIGDTVRIYNISVNPSLPDSLFQHS
jgi:hypothetical protein